jgi:hypothetical protein
MRDQFAHFYAPDDAAIATAMKTGLVVPDANVVLHLYRFQSEARDELFGVFEGLDARLWIPHQVGLEFQRNRLTVMSEQEGYFDAKLKELSDSTKALRDKFRAFKRRLSPGDEHVQKIEEAITSLDELVGAEIVKAKESNEVHLKDHASDEVRARIDTLFENRVGSPMEPKELEAAKKEAEKRIKEKIPPGYMDRKKVDPTGDYLVWRQLMTEAKSRSLPVVFITDDTKEDWYGEFKGMTLGARYELREEMNREAGVPLLMMTTETFLHHAETFLNAAVSSGTFVQAKELPKLYHVHSYRAIAWRTLAEDSESLHELLLLGIRTGRGVSSVELKLAMPALAVQLGDELVPRVVKAVSDGLETGDLTKDDGTRILTALKPFIVAEDQPPAETPDE